MNPTDRYWWRVFLAFLIAAAMLRVAVVTEGGQLFWSDEDRYHVSHQALAQFLDGEATDAWQALLRTAEHPLFKLIMLAPALLQQGINDPAVPALFLAAFSVLNIALVWRIARQAGAGSREAAIAAGLMTCANTGFYYVRHYLPYDMALTFGLLAMLRGWTGTGWRRSLECGLLAGAGFLTYSGSWLFGGLALTGHVLLAGRAWKEGVVRGVVGAIGLALPIIALIGAAGLTGADLLADFLRFSQTVNQGDFGYGFELVLEYFWAAEGFNLVFAILGVALVCGGALAARTWTYGMRWVAGFFFILAGILLLSDFWHKFVVYGRTVRQLVPLACLAMAFAGERLWRSGGKPRTAAAVAGVLILIQAVANLAGPLGLVFPNEFQALAAQRMQALQLAGEQRQLVVIHADRLLGEQAFFEALPDHDVIMAERNPMQFGPYQYEGHPRALRERIKRNDVSMRLIAVNRPWLGQPVELQRPYPGVVQMLLRLSSDRIGAREPLIVTGSTGRGDLLYLIYESPTSVRLGFDHWGIGGLVSDSIEVDFSRPISFTLSLGTMHPPDRAAGAGPSLNSWLYARINDRIVWSRSAEFHPVAPSSITFGANYIGGSTCGTRFTGEVIEIKSLVGMGSLSISDRLAQPRPGAVKLVVQFPPGRVGEAEPLLLTGRVGAADLIYVVYDSPTTIRLGFDHWGVGGFVSEPVAIDLGRPTSIVLSMGSMHAAASGSGINPAEVLYAAVEGKTVWMRPAGFHAAESGTLALGANPVGASTCGPRFTGIIIEVESVPFPPAPAAPDLDGPNN